MSNPPHGLATPDLRQRLPTTNHGPAAPQIRVYQSDRASRTACRTATHPADHIPHRPPRKREIRDVPLTNVSPYQLGAFGGTEEVRAARPAVAPGWPSVDALAGVGMERLSRAQLGHGRRLVGSGPRLSAGSRGADRRAHRPRTAPYRARPSPRHQPSGQSVVCWWRAHSHELR